MSRGLYWDAGLSIHPHEALMQQGFSFTAGARNAAVADNGVVRCIFDVQSVMHANFQVSVGGDSWIDFSTVTSYEPGAGTSLSVFNRNTEFTDVNTFSAKLFGNSSIHAGSLGMFQGVIPGGTKQSATGGRGQTDELHLHAGIYQLEVTNKSGAAIDIGVSVTWEEVHKEV